MNVRVGQVLSGAVQGLFSFSFFFSLSAWPHFRLPVARKES